MVMALPFVAGVLGAQEKVNMEEVRLKNHFSGGRSSLKTFYHILFTTNVISCS